MSKNIVVVGAGPGGLANAMLLANSGANVTVLERSGAVGGRTSTVEENDHKFDLGPTFFMYPQVLWEVYSQCGYNLDEEVEMYRLDPHYKLHFEDRGSLTIRSDQKHMEDEIQKFSP